MKKMLVFGLACALLVSGLGGATVFAQTAETDRYEKSNALATDWRGAQQDAGDFTPEDITSSGYTYQGVAFSNDAGAPNAFSFSGEDGYVLSAGSFASVGTGVAIEWYFNMKGSGYGAVEVAPEIGFAALSSSGDPQTTEGAASIILGETGVRAAGEGADGGSPVVSVGVDTTVASVYEWGTDTQWESNIQLKVVFYPSENRIEVQKCKTATDGSTFHVVAAVENIAVPDQNVSVAMFLAASNNLTLTHWALPSIATVQTGSTVPEEYPAVFTGSITGSDGGIFTKDAQTLGKNDSIVLEMDITETAAAGDWIGFGLGRSGSASGSTFGNAADSLTVYYGAAGGGTQVGDANLDVAGWLPHEYAVSQVFAAGRHIRVEWNPGAGTYKLESTAAEGEAIVHELTGLKFKSLENVYMGFVADSSFSVGVSEMQFYTWKEKAEYVVMDLIDAIGTVEYTDECKGKIDSARAAYDALTAEEKELVTNLATLTEAESVYAALAEAAEAHVANAEALIAAIGTVEYTDECKGKIDSARDAYDALTDTEKAMVENAAVLTAAEEKYEELRAADETAKVENVIRLIGDIGTVEYSDECKAKIDAARAAYDALSDALRERVSNYATLTAAESEYKVLQQLAEQMAKDQAAAAEADALIGAIGTVEYTDECKAKIDAARAAYDALTSAQKGLVKGLDDLTAAETAYTDMQAAAGADALIGAIGEVEYTDECKEKIDSARGAYDALTESQKGYVGNLSELTSAEATYAAMQAAAGVDALIAAIGKVENTEESKAKIDAARAAYDALTEAEKAHVTQLSVLEGAEESYAAYSEQKGGCSSAAEGGLAAVAAVALGAAVIILARKKRA